MYIHMLKSAKEYLEKILEGTVRLLYARVNILKGMCFENTLFSMALETSWDVADFKWSDTLSHLPWYWIILEHASE